MKWWELCSGLFVVVTQVHAGWTDAQAYQNPANVDNHCSTNQKAGLSFHGLPLGRVERHQGFDFSGMTYGESARGSTTSGHLQCTLDRRGGASFRQSDQKPFSISSITMSTDQATDVDLLFAMPDGSTCRQRTACSAEAVVLHNSQCGGAVGVSLQLPAQASTDSCTASLHEIVFDCQPPETASTTTVGSSSGSTSTTVVTSTSSAPSTSSTTLGTSRPSSVSSATTSTSVSTSTDKSDSKTTGSTRAASVPASFTDRSSSVKNNSTVVSATSTTRSSWTTVSNSTVLSTTTTSSCSTSVTTAAQNVTTTVPPTSTWSISTTRSSMVDSQRVPALGSNSTLSQSRDTTTAVLTLSTSSTLSTMVSGTSLTALGPTVFPNVPCPEVLPRCLNTWLTMRSSCASNVDVPCLCPDRRFTDAVIDCVQAWARDGPELSFALSALAGMCVDYIPRNPGLCAIPFEQNSSTSVVTVGPEATGVSVVSAYSAWSGPPSVTTVVLTRTLTTMASTVPDTTTYVLPVVTFVSVAPTTVTAVVTTVGSGSAAASVAAATTTMATATMTSAGGSSRGSGGSSASTGTVNPSLFTGLASPREVPFIARHMVGLGMAAMVVLG